MGYRTVAEVGSKGWRWLGGFGCGFLFFGPGHFQACAWPSIPGRQGLYKYPTHRLDFGPRRPGVPTAREHGKVMGMY